MPGGRLRGMPPGGLADQMVVKNSSSPGDEEWRSVLPSVVTATGGPSPTWWIPPIGTFETAPISSADPNWSGNVYNVPVAGSYLLLGKLRVADGAPASEFGLGIHTANVDGTWFNWVIKPASAGTARQTSPVQRIMTLTVGQQLRLYGYVQLATSFHSAELVIQLLKEA